MSITAMMHKSQKTNDEDADVVIIGAGPAGASCALSLRNSGLKVVIIDRADFPRDKVCGDALSVDVINQLPLLSPAFPDAFESVAEKIPSLGVRIVGPDGTSIELPFINKRGENKGYVFSRLNFDNVLVTALREQNDVVIREGEAVTGVAIHDSAVAVSLNEGSVNAKMVVEACGTSTIIGGAGKIDRRHFSAGLRMYFEGVTGFNNGNFIELFFFKDILPGYLWVFPMAGGRANVGIGVLSSSVSSKKLNLKNILLDKVRNHPLLSGRFAAATATDEVRGHGLPLGSQKKKISGERFIRVGDAASLIDPFTGEGIGNAIRSGRIAADHIRRCFGANRFDASFNHEYDREIYRRMGREFKLSHALQRLCKNPVLFNFVIRRASTSRKWHEFLVQSLADMDYKRQLTRPVFYYRLLFQ